MVQQGHRSRLSINGAPTLLILVWAPQKPLKSHEESQSLYSSSCWCVGQRKSEHHNKYEDRLWDFGCKATFDTATNCFTSSYVNAFDKPFSYQCPSHQVITGMHSYHENKYEDRRWKFTCCGASNFCTDTCQWTNYVNWFDEAFTFNVPPNSYLNAAESYHENKYEDRRWKFQHCTRRSC
uniref:Uncharacterized protein n=1 Tax=Hucho hucho TaxID=62062 RepID=A0A4W5R8A6_9TELE